MPSSRLVHWVDPAAVTEDQFPHSACRAAVINAMHDQVVDAALLMIVSPKAMHRERLVTEGVALYSSALVPGTWHPLPEQGGAGDVSR